jgi:hypothetical protein
VRTRACNISAGVGLFVPRKKVPPSRRAFLSRIKLLGQACLLGKLVVGFDMSTIVQTRNRSLMFWRKHTYARESWLASETMDLIYYLADYREKYYALLKTVSGEIR